MTPAAGACALALSVGAAAARADLDIGVPPEADLPKAPPPLQSFGGLNPMGAARILAMDVVAHHPRTSWRRQDSAPEELACPPRTRSDLHGLVLCALMRPAMRRAQVSVAETLHYLIEIGPPVHDTLENSGEGLASVKALVDYLMQTIPRTPPEPPAPEPLLQGIEDPELRMPVRWAAQELVSHHPYSYNPLHARRTLSLGGEAVPVLLACAKSSHPLLRENATGVLAAYGDYDERVAAALRERLRGKDPVARNRALGGLVRLRDPEVEELLLEALETQDPFLPVYAIEKLRASDAWLRYAAFRALRAVSGEKHFADWLFADGLDREDGVRAWKKWREGPGAALASDEELVARAKAAEEDARKKADDPAAQRKRKFE